MDHSRIRHLLRSVIQRLLHKVAFVMTGGYTFRPILHRLRGVRIGKGAWIGQYVYIDDMYPAAVSIGDNTSIGLRTSIIAHLHWGSEHDIGTIRPLVIGANVFVGPHCVILPGVTIGDGSVVQAGTVVSRNVPPHMFWGAPAAGPIARVSVPLTYEHTYAEFVSGLRKVHTGNQHSSRTPTSKTSGDAHGSD
jgi:serine acetyltransferase